jgi:hypothetical protein
MTRARASIAGLLGALLLVGAGAGPAPAQMLIVPETTGRYFRVEFDVTHNRKGSAVEGYLVLSYDWSCSGGGGGGGGM